MSASSQAQELKEQGNEYFKHGKFQEAERIYSEALLIVPIGQTSLRLLLYTNRAAARISMREYITAMEDVDDAIDLDPTSVKAYYRKSTIYEHLGQYNLAYLTWKDAKKYCNTSDSSFVKQYHTAEQKWLKQFRDSSFLVTSTEDLLARYELLHDKRERLSTLAHFWNDSTKEERFGYFKLFLELVGGEGALSETFQEILKVEIMEAMPMENYPDFPRVRLIHWFDYFQQLDSSTKGVTFRGLWNLLSAEEKNDVIVDLKYFISNHLPDEYNPFHRTTTSSARKHKHKSKEVEITSNNTVAEQVKEQVGEEEEGEDDEMDVDEKDIDFSYRKKL